MMRITMLVVAAGATAATCGAADAADSRYPNWPCAQAKVPELSVAAVWDGPSIDAVGETWENDPKVRDLVARLAARRTPLEEAQKAARDFIAASGADKAEKAEKAKLLFAGLFQQLNQQRTEVMDGIDRITQKEKELADQIRADRAALSDLQDKPDPDRHQIDEVGNKLIWGTRIYEDRRKTIRYVCDVPTEIERRLFALGRAISQAAAQ
jgi:Spy/CpxP family protein refolding chaperone